MTYTEFLRHVGKAGLTVKAFADLIKMNCVSLSNCAKKGEVPSHLAVIAALMGEMADKGLDYRSVIARIDIARKKPRGAGREGRFGGDPERELDLFKSDDTHR
ncbi:XRE family transcriptional regulator [Paraburkholderia sp. SIMBA_049]